MKKFDCEKYCGKSTGKFMFLMCVYLLLQELAHFLMDYFKAPVFVKGMIIGIEFCVIVAIFFIGFKWAKAEQLQMKENKDDKEVE